LVADPLSHVLVIEIVLETFLNDPLFQGDSVDDLLLFLVYFIHAFFRDLYLGEKDVSRYF